MLVRGVYHGMYKICALQRGQRLPIITKLHALS